MVQIILFCQRLLVCVCVICERLFYKMFCLSNLVRRSRHLQKLQLAVKLVLLPRPIERKEMVLGAVAIVVHKHMYDTSNRQDGRQTDRQTDRQTVRRMQLTPHSDISV